MSSELALDSNGLVRLAAEDRESNWLARLGVRSARRSVVVLELPPTNVGGRLWKIVVRCLQCGCDIRTYGCLRSHFWKSKEK